VTIRKGMGCGRRRPILRSMAQPGGIALETKKDVVKRLGWSPDEADAAVMALIGMPVVDGAVKQIEVRAGRG
jgi:hypothetical protein